MAARGRVDKRLATAMRRRRRRSGDERLKNGVKMGGECVSAGVNVDGRFVGFNKDCFFYAPFDPVLFRGKDGYVLFAKAMSIFAGMGQLGML